MSLTRSAGERMSRTATRVSVPGKLILMGEHAAVYGMPALVTSLGLRMTLLLEPRAAPGVQISLPDLGSDERVAWGDIRARAASLRHAWLSYADDPTPERFRQLRPRGPGDLVAVALGEVVEAVGDHPERDDHPCRGLRVRIESAIPVGAGFGSSAAAAVGVVAGYLATRRLEHGWAAVDTVALQVERRQHGFPSGIDSATVFHGGLLRCRRAEDGLRFEPLAARSGVLRALRVFDTGPPAESTGVVVAEVRARRDRSPDVFAAELRRMQEATARLQTVLVDPAAAARDLLEPIRAYHRALVALGVVPDSVGELIARVEEAGGAAKISGAGSLSGPGAGSLLAVHPEPEALAFLAQLQRHDVSLAVEGLRVEAVA